MRQRYPGGALPDADGHGLSEAGAGWGWGAKSGDDYSLGDYAL